MDKEKWKNIIGTAVKFITNPRLLLCFGIAWIITNGWSYISFALGTYFEIGWLTAVATAYMALLWVPFTPEKIITVAISIALLKLLFPNDKKTLGILREMRRKAKARRQAKAESRAASDGASAGAGAPAPGGRPGPRPSAAPRKGRKPAKP